jgi:uncharacterized coiled-coil protein SlyX
MANIPNRRPRPKSKSFDDHLEELEMYAEFKAKVLPELRQMMAKGTNDKDILKTFSKHVAARLVSIALTEPDSQKAMSAVKELLDRVHGKSTDNKSIKHEFAELNDTQLDALIMTELSDIDDSEIQ